jgi:hemerythrin-like metal-binding protein
MEFFHWKDSFEIDAAEIDRQHRSFLELLNEYYDSSTGGTRDKIGSEFVDRLRAYVVMHFRFEETVMQEAGYPELERQKMQHRYFESLVSELESAQQRGKTEALKSALLLLRDWFLCHIIEEDRKFVPYIKSPK